MTSIRKSIFILLLFFSSHLMAACLHTPTPPATDQASLSVEEELQARARREQRILEESGSIIRDEEIETYLMGVAEKILPGSSRERRFLFRIIEGTRMNAFAFPDGVVYIHCGMLSRMENEAQLAFVLAHEMTHVTHKHAFRAYEKRREQAPGWAGGFGGPDPLPGLGAHDTGSMDAYARDLEAEADRIGFERALAAGYSPGEVLRLLRRMNHPPEYEKTTDAIVLTAHPDMEERILRYEAFLSRMEAKGGNAKNEEVYRFHTRRMILRTARLDLMEGRFPAALKGAEKYLEICPFDAEGYFLKGEVYRQWGKWEDLERAKKAYHRAILLNPAYPDPQAALGLIYFKRGEKGLARRHFETCLSVSPDVPEKAYILGYLKECIR
jgi:beta-barrel assembly-enhancing protease